MEKITESREKEIIKVSSINIVVNLILSTFKGIVGFLSNSIAIQADAVNSLSDALAAVITIIGIKLSGKEPNKNHPLGYGRYEYLSDGVVAFLVVYAGIETLIDSFKKIMNPEIVDYSYITLLVLAVAVVAKIFLGIFEQKSGEKSGSKALKAAGIDSLSDAVVTSAVFISAIIYMIFEINLEAYLGLIISVIIIKSGFEMFKDTIDEILGKRVQGDLINNIKELLTEDEKVFGAFDLVLHSYGPEKYIGSIHIEVPSDLTMEELDKLERKLTRKVYDRYGVYLSGIGVYSVDVVNQEVIEFRNRVNEIINKYENVLQLHGFVVNIKEKKLRFDLIIDFVENSDKLVDSIKKDILKVYPGYDIYIQKDLNIDL